ncbi:hypothetical protein GCM10009647_085460 [Streptomyces sanglieri]
MNINPERTPEVVLANHSTSPFTLGTVLVRFTSSEIEEYAEAIEGGKQHVQMAESLFEQYLERSEHTLVAELYVASSFYCACKVNGAGIDPTEVASIGPAIVKRKHLLQRAKQIATTLGLDPSAFFDPIQYVDRYCEEMELDDDIRDAAHAMLETAEEKAITSGKPPSALAAGAVYAAALREDRQVNQEEVSEVANVSTVTIRKRYKELLKASSDDGLFEYEAGVEDLCEKLNLSSTVEQESKRVLSELFSTIDARSTDTMPRIAAVVHSVCLEHDETVTLEEVSSACDVPVSTITGGKDSDLQDLID